MENKVILSIDTRGVAEITLNNPDKHNAFDDEVIALLTDAFKEVADNDAVRVVVLSSNGKSFSAGADLGWMKRMASYSLEQNKQDADALAELFRTITFLPQPTIAKIQGAAFGGAVGLTACCDIAIASQKASFCLSEVKLGLIPATIGPYVVSAMGLRNAKRYFMTAERFFAEKAMELGLVSEVVAPEQLDVEVDNMIATLLANGPTAVCQAKKLALDIASKPITAELIDDTSARIAAIRVSEEGQEGLGAFFDKRAPKWQQASEE
jgi:methylglutaconyl-CoA hydratase